MYDGIRAQLVSSPSRPLDIKGTPFDWNTVVRAFAEDDIAAPTPFQVFVHPRTAYTLNDPRVQETWRWHYPTERRMKSEKWYRRRNKVRLRMQREADRIAREVGEEYDAKQQAEFDGLGLTRERLMEAERAVMGN